MRKSGLSCSECLEYCGEKDRQIAEAALKGLFKRALSSKEITLNEIWRWWGKRDINADEAEIVLNKQSFFELLLPLVAMNPMVIAAWVHDKWESWEKSKCYAHNTIGNMELLRGYLALEIEVYKTWSDKTAAENEKTWLHEMLLASHCLVMAYEVICLSYLDVSLCEMAKELKQNAYVVPSSVEYAVERLTDQQVEEYGEKYLEVLEKLCGGAKKSTFNHYMWKAYMSLAKRCMAITNNKAEKLANQVYNKARLYFMRQIGSEASLLKVMDDIELYFGPQKLLEFVEKAVASHAQFVGDLKRDVSVYGVMILHLLKSLPDTYIPCSKLLKLLSAIRSARCPHYLVAEGYAMLCEKIGMGNFDEQLLQNIAAGNSDYRKVLLCFFSFHTNVRDIKEAPWLVLALLLILKKPQNVSEAEKAKKMLGIMLVEYWHNLQPVKISEQMWRTIIKPVSYRDFGLENVLWAFMQAKLVQPELIVAICKEFRVGINFAEPKWRIFLPEYGLNVREKLNRQSLIKKLAE